MNKYLLAGLMVGTLTASAPAMAEDHSHHMHHAHHTEARHVHTGGHAPISIMGDHMHKEGEWMISVRHSRMNMEGNRVGTNDVSPEEIVTNHSINAFSSTGTNRVVPTSMTMDMTMLGAMYGLTDDITLMLMGMYMDKEMEHLTFMGLAGTTPRGTFTTSSTGWGDTSLSALIRLYDDKTHHLHLQAGISAPTGAINKADDVLAPNGTTPTLRLPYAMQLGTGTWDVLPGLTYTASKDSWNWGAQYKGAIRLESENSRGYSWGDHHLFNVWAGHQVNQTLQVNARASFETMGKIDGSDSLVAAPVQTADPNNYGGETAELAAGLNFTPPSLKNHQIGLEFSAPIHQDLNGPQMERDWSVNAGWIIRF